MLMMTYFIFYPCVHAHYNIFIFIFVVPPLYQFSQTSTGYDIFFVIKRRKKIRRDKIFFFGRRAWIRERQKQKEWDRRHIHSATYLQLTFYILIHFIDIEILLDNRWFFSRKKYKTQNCWVDTRKSFRLLLYQQNRKTRSLIKTFI